MTKRDMDRIQGLHPSLIADLMEIFVSMGERGWTMFVVEGLRTVARQRQLWQIGRNLGDDARGIKVVTFKDGIQHRSNHQPHADGFGYAVDCAFLPTIAFGDPFDLAFPWIQYGELGEAHKLIWGGRWRMGDHPHLELPDLTEGLKA